MRYFGGKQRISKPLSEFLNSQLEDGQPFVDLFCGSCNVISKIDSNRIRIANDKHEYLIAMWKALQDGWIPPKEVSEEMYYDVRNNLDIDKALSGFVGFGCSFSGKWWGGYARGGEKRNYAENAINTSMKKMKSMQDVVFVSGNYQEVQIPSNSFIYCDIPYKNTTGYSVGDFNHEKFYAWCEEMVNEGHDILVSEYSHNVPDNWEVIWRHKSKKDIRNKAGEQEATLEVIMRPKYA